MVLVESAPGVGECELGEECEALSLRADYLAYRDAHIRIVAEWRTGIAMAAIDVDEDPAGDAGVQRPAVVRHRYHLAFLRGVSHFPTARSCSIN